MKLIKFEPAKEGYMYPEAWIAFGKYKPSGLYLSIIYGKGSLDTYTYFDTKSIITEYRRKAIRFHLYWNTGKTNYGLSDKGKV